MSLTVGTNDITSSKPAFWFGHYDAVNFARLEPCQHFIELSNFCWRPNLRGNQFRIDHREFSIQGCWDKSCERSAFTAQMNHCMAIGANDCQFLQGNLPAVDGGAGKWHQVVNVSEPFA